MTMRAKKKRQHAKSMMAVTGIAMEAPALRLRHPQPPNNNTYTTTTNNNANNKPGRLKTKRSCFRRAGRRRSTSASRMG
jgi:hypothetical protein